MLSDGLNIRIVESLLASSLWFRFVIGILKLRNFDLVNTSTQFFSSKFTFTSFVLSRGIHIHTSSIDPTSGSCSIPRRTKIASDTWITISGVQQRMIMP
jgi:hypothetical protein